MESGQTAADIDEKLSSIDGVATKSVDDQDLSQGFVRVSTSDKTSVEDAMKQLKSAGLESQPNYAYSLADDDSGQQKGSTDLADAMMGASGTQMKSASKAGANDGAEPSAETNDPISDNASDLSATDVTSAWELVKTNKRVSVAVLDTGFRTSHKDLKNNIVATYDATVANPANGLTGDVKDVTDLQGHGTHVAGIVSAEANNGKGIAGISYNAGIVGVKVFPSYDVRNVATDTNKSLPYCYTDDIVYGYDYVIANRSKYNIRVINMSIFGAHDDEDILFDSKIKEAYKDGIVSVCCAGNTNPHMDDDPNSTTNYMPFSAWPSNSSSPLVAVMNMRCIGVDSYDYLNGTSNFNTATETQGHTNKNICAPGTGIESTYSTGDDKYTYMTGTSMASPFVAGVLALEFAANNNLTPAEAIDDLYKSATDMDNPNYETGWDQYTGYGLVNAYRAVTFALGDSTKRDISKARISPIPIQLLSENEATQPEPTVMYGYTKLSIGKDYTVSYSDNAKVGSGKVSISGIGNYYGTLQRTYYIIDKVPDLATDSTASFGYTPATMSGYSKPEFGVSLQTENGDWLDLSDGVDYDATLSAVDSNGNAVMTVTGKGAF